MQKQILFLAFATAGIANAHSITVELSIDPSIEQEVLQELQKDGKALIEKYTNVTGVRSVQAEIDGQDVTDKCGCKPRPSAAEDVTDKCGCKPRPSAQEETAEETRCNTCGKPKPEAKCGCQTKPRPVADDATAEEARCCGKPRPSAVEDVTDKCGCKPRPSANDDAAENRCGICGKPKPEAKCGCQTKPRPSANE